MMKRGMALLLALILMLTLAPASMALNNLGTAYVTGGWLRLRSAPSFQAETIASYASGTPVTVHEILGDWYHVSLADGKSGYMLGSYLRWGGSQPVSDIAYITSSNGKPVRLRSGPGTNYGVIATYRVGTQVTILSRGTTWHYIRIGSQTGYMMSQYLTSSYTPTPTAQPQTGYTAYVTSSNGLAVRLRSGPGTNFGVIGTYNPGTRVTVLNHGSVWDYIKTATQTGYMMTKFLTTSTPQYNQVTAVAISSMTPRVGDTLWATVTPSGAAVLYTWFNENGTYLANTQSYTVKSSDLGHTLRVMVAGTSGWSGTAYSGTTSPVTGSGGTTQLTGVTIDTVTPRVGQVMRASLTPAGASATFAWYRSDGSLVSSSSSYTPVQNDVGFSFYVVAIGTGSSTGAVTSAYTGQTVSGAVTDTALSGYVSLPLTSVTGIPLTPTISLNSSNVTYAWYMDGTLVGTGSQLIPTMEMAGHDVRLVVTAMPGSGYQGSVSSGYCTIYAMLGL
ncbi:MAG: SH3 domain-containing protein [Clostridia bacterium]|nr:SH3 domain-containing protein [Clostridia bacterium]